MENPISGLIDKAAESILQTKIAGVLPELPDPKEQSDRLKEEMDWNNLSDKEKEEKQKLIDNLEGSINDAKAKQEEAIKDAAKKNAAVVDELKGELSELGTSAGLLSVGTLEFAARIAMVPMAIISVTPMGPGVSANLIPPLLKSLKAEGDNLSKVYDDCTNKMSKLGLPGLVGREAINPLIDLGPITSIVSTITGVMSVAKPLILMVGASVGGDTGTPPDVQPPIDVELKAEECAAYTPPEDADPELEPSAEVCTKFQSISGEEVPESERTCSKCKNYMKK